MLEFYSSVLSAAVILYRDGFQMTAKKLHDSLCNFILTFFLKMKRCASVPRRGWFPSSYCRTYTESVVSNR